jgi:hypothetical protein
MNFDCNTVDVRVEVVDEEVDEEDGSDVDEDVGKFWPKYDTQSLGLK